jgi:hypothetical protein
MKRVNGNLVFKPSVKFYLNSIEEIDIAAYGSGNFKYYVRKDNIEEIY